MVRQLSSLEIQILRAISEGCRTPAEIAKRLNVSFREVQRIANFLALENFIRIRLGSNLFEPSENETYWLLQEGSRIVARQGLTASTQVLAAVQLPDLQRAIVILLYNYGDTYDTSIRKLLQKRLGFFATDEQVSQAVESLLSQGILTVKTSFAIFLFVASFVRRRVGLTPYGYEIARKSV